MKRTAVAAFLLAAILASGKSFAQDTLRIKYSQSWQPTTDPDSVAYTRKAWKSGGLWQVRDYYYPGGKLQMKGAFTDDSFSIQSGPFAYYSSDGRKTEEGRYVNGKKDGPWNGWFSDGAVDCENNYKDGEYEGRNRWFHDNGKVSEESVYENGEIISTKFWDSDGHPQPEGVSGIQYPAFKGGGEGLRGYLIANLKYPMQARRQGIEGRAQVQFIINKDGTVSDIKCTQSSGNSLLDKEAVRVVKAMPPWMPGTYHNRAVRAVYKQPVTFKLD